MKKYTIVIPTFNSEKNIRACLSSVLNIDFQNFSVIVCDNNSKDNTIKILKSFKDKRLKIKLHKKTLSKTENWNRAYKYCLNSKYILNVHSDIIINKKILKIYDRFNNKNKFSVIFSVSSSNTKKHFPFPYIINNNFNKISVMGSNVNIFGSLMNANNFKKCGLWLEGHEQNQDTDMWIKISQLGSIIYLPLVLSSDTGRKQSLKLIKSNLKKKLIYYLYLLKQKDFFLIRKNILCSVKYYINECKKLEVPHKLLLKKYNYSHQEKKLAFENFYIMGHKILGVINFFFKFPILFFQILLKK